MKLGDTLSKSEAQKEKPKGTDRFLKSKFGVLLKVYENKRKDMFLLLDEGVTPVILEEGDMLYNDNGTIRERIDEAISMVVKNIYESEPEPGDTDYEPEPPEIQPTEPKKPEKKRTMRKRRGKELSEATPPVDVEVLPPQTSDLEQADLLEARDISGNSDLVLQYSAPFRNRKTGKTDQRSWLGVNAWKLGLIEGYIKKGFSCEIGYNDDKEVRICHITLTKDKQCIEVSGKYTKNRLKSFLSEAKNECFDTFAFRNALKKIVSLKDVIEAVITTQQQVKEMQQIPTREITDAR